jgi:hypothetical protein
MFGILVPLCGVMLHARCRMSPIQIWFCRALLLCCCVIICSCSFSVFNWRKTNSDSTNTEKQNSDHPKTSAVDKKSTAEWSEAGSGSASRKVGSSLQSDDSETPADGDRNAVKQTNGENKPGNGGSKKLAERKQEDSNPEEGIGESLGSYEKFDHVSYRKKIRRKAIDIVNKHKKCSLARLCKDFYTDQWSLRIYKKGLKKYSFIAYSWDPVTEDWSEDFKSPLRPVSTWKRNVKMSAAGKECESIKGRMNHD